jgi:hypothetical protein
MRQPVSTRDALVRFIAILIALAAGLCAIYAVLAFAFVCRGDDAQSSSCAGGRGRDWELVAQMFVAVIASVLAVAMLNRVWRGAWHTAAWLLALTLIAFGAWNVLLAAAT